MANTGTLIVMDPRGRALKRHANMLTNQALDAYGKIPELKFCAARMEAL